MCRRVESERQVVRDRELSAGLAGPAHELPVTRVIGATGLIWGPASSTVAGLSYLVAVGDRRGHGWRSHWCAQTGDRQGEDHQQPGAYETIAPRPTSSRALRIGGPPSTCSNRALLQVGAPQSLTRSFGDSSISRGWLPEVTAAEMGSHLYKGPAGRGCSCWCPRPDSDRRTRLRRPIWTVQTVFPVRRSAPEQGFLSWPSVWVLPVAPI